MEADGVGEGFADEGVIEWVDGVDEFVVGVVGTSYNPSISKSIRGLVSIDIGVGNIGLKIEGITYRKIWWTGNTYFSSFVN